MTAWRIGQGWSEAELAEKLRALYGLERNFSDPPESLSMEKGWHHYSSEAVIARTSPAPPEEGGPFTRGRNAVAGYEFSDPNIVVAHFDPGESLLGRRILLELKVLRVLRYLGGVVVGAVRSERSADQTVFGFRYDTLEGHIEQGAEWFLLTKEHATGIIRFRIEALWRPGQFPNWWSRIGFALVGRRYQEIWHRRAHRFMARIVQNAEPPSPSRVGARRLHAHPEVVFKRSRPRHV